MMTTVNLRRFTEPETLKEMAPALLLGLLEPHRIFFGDRGVALPPAGTTEGLDYDRLAWLFLSPDDIPPEVVEKFHLVKQMSRIETMDHILDTVRSRRRPVTFAPNSSPLDVAAHLLLSDRKLFDELHAERAAERQRGFTFYVARKKPASFRPPQDLQALEKDLNKWYEAKQRGQSARLFAREHGHEWWCCIRHAEPVKREGAVDLASNESRSMIYRPERFGVVVYDSRAAEIRVHAEGRREPEMFRQMFGWHLFGDLEFFPKSRQKYTLEPLKTAGRRALTCAGIPGLEEITLRELVFLCPGERWVRDRCSADDVFSSFEEYGRAIPATAEVRLAKFAVRFSDAEKPRMVTIRPSNYALFPQDDDAVILAPWFEREGFLVKNDVEENEMLAGLMVGE
jgi:hypothetical protein